MDKPCPFCGSTNLTHASVPTLGVEMNWVSCLNCQAVGPTDPDPEEAIRKWNTRASPQTRSQT